MSPRDRLGLSLFYAFAFAGVAFMPFVNLYLKAQGLSYAQIGAMAALSSLGGVLMLLPVGWLSDRLGRRRGLIILTAAGVGLIYASYPLAAGFPGFAVRAFLAGICWFCSMSLTGALALDVARRAGEGASGAFASVRVWGSVGYIALLLVAAATPLQAALDTSVAFPILAGLYLAAGLSVLLVREGRHEESGLAPRLRLADLGVLVADRNLLTAVAAFLLFNASLMGGSTLLSFLLRGMGADNQQITYAYLISAGIEVPFMLGVGRLSDRVGRRGPLLVAFLVLPVRLALYALLPGVGWVYAGQLLHGLTFSVIQVVSLAFVNDSVPPALRASGQSLLTLTFAISTAAGPLAAGAIGDRWGLPPVYLALSGVAILGLLLFALRVREPVRESQAAVTT